MFDNPIAAGAANGLAEKRGDELSYANSQIAKANADARHKNARIAELETVLLEEKSKVHQWNAHANALSAQNDALRKRLNELSPGDSLFERVGAPFVKGEHTGLQKSRLRLIYERAFDATLLKLGIKNPSKWRDG